jgi:hypothetical protein
MKLLRIAGISLALLVCLAPGSRAQLSPHPHQGPATPKPIVTIADLDRTRLSGAQHLVWFRLIAKVSAATQLDVCISDSNTGGVTCSNTVNVRPDESTQAIFMIATLNAHTSVSIRRHGQHEDLLMEKLPGAPMLSGPQAFAWTVAALLLAAMAYWTLAFHRRQAREAAAVRKSIDDSSVRDKGLAEYLGGLEGRTHFSVDNLRKEAQSQHQTVKAILAEQAAMRKRSEQTLTLLWNGLLDPATVLLAPNEDGLKAVLWVALRAWFYDSRASLPAVADFIKARGYEAEVVDMASADGSHEFKPNPAGSWLLSGVAGSDVRFVSLLERTPGADFAGLKEMMGTAAEGPVEEIERPCRLEPDPGTKGRYVVKAPGVIRMKGVNAGGEDSLIATLIKRVNALIGINIAPTDRTSAAQMQILAKSVVRKLKYAVAVAEQEAQRSREQFKELEARLKALEQRDGGGGAALPALAASPAIVPAAAVAGQTSADGKPDAGGATTGSAKADLDLEEKLPSELAEDRSPGLFPSLSEGWWSQAVESSGSEGDGSADDYFLRVLLLREHLQQTIDGIGNQFASFVAWVRSDEVEDRFRLIRARVAEGGAWVHEPDRPERQLIGRELFQLFVGVEESGTRRGALLIIPSGTFSVDQHITVLNRIVNDPPVGRRRIRRVEYPAELWRDKGSLYRLNPKAKLVLEYYAEEEE